MNHKPPPGNPDEEGHDDEPEYMKRAREASPAALSQMIADKLRPEQTTAVGLNALQYANLTDFDSARRENEEVVRRMDAVKGLNAKSKKATIRRKFICKIARQYLEKTSWRAKMDPEVMQHVQQRLKPLAAIRDEFALTDGYVSGLLKGLKRGPRKL